MSEADLAAFNDVLSTHIPAAGRMGVRAVERRRGHARTELPLDGDAEGKAEFTLDAEIVDADGTVVATTTGTYQIRQHGR